MWLYRPVHTQMQTEIYNRKQFFIDLGWSVYLYTKHLNDNSSV